jgi:uridine kinase
MPNQASDVIRLCDHIITMLQPWTANRTAPLLVALDGGSGAGKSTLTAQLAQRGAVAVVPLDDFWSAMIPDAAWDQWSVEARAAAVFDWARVRRDALEPLLAGRTARWYPVDFAAGAQADGTYRLQETAVRCAPAPIILLEGAYAAHPALTDLVHVTILLDVPVTERHRRLAGREPAAFLAQWHRRWDAVEADYFTHLRPRSTYDLVVTLA